MYYVYILYSEGFDTYYVGQTNNIESRLERHNKGYEKYTSKYRPWKLLLSIEKTTRSEAKALEKKLKNLSKERTRSFIENYG